MTDFVSDAAASGVRVLYVAVSTGHLAVFHRPYLRWLRERGHRVDVAAGESPGFALPEASAVHRLDFARSPLSPRNLRAFARLVALLRAERYDLVHCHTPVASALSRLASVFARGRPVVIYTAHGFHFFPGAPRANWLVWFPAEWLLARLTDILVTINAWDFDAARRRLGARDVRRVPGMGVDLARFRPWPAAERAAKRAELGLAQDDFVLLYIAEFIPRKNHALLLEAFARVCRDVPHAKLLLPGDGPLQEAMRAACVARGLGDRVRFLGFRRDIPALANVADLAVSTSRHEGLPIGLVEVMACGVPILASEDRGHRELVVEGETGHIFAQEDAAGLADRIVALSASPSRRAAMGEAARRHVARFALDAALPAMVEIYEDAERLIETRRHKGAA
ncbi:glycosyltransferase family 4 protein [Sphingomonas sp. CJ20]